MSNSGKQRRWETLSTVDRNSQMPEVRRTLKTVFRERKERKEDQAGPIETHRGSSIESPVTMSRWAPPGDRVSEHEQPDGRSLACRKNGSPTWKKERARLTGFIALTAEG